MNQIKRGAQGEAVRLLQQYLKIPADGIFGPATEKAVEAFQAQHGLTADGIVGAKTWCALETDARRRIDDSGPRIIYTGERAPLAAKIQSVIDVCIDGKVGYYKNPMSDVERLALPKFDQWTAGRVEPDPDWDTLRSIGTCNMAQEFVISLLTGVPPRIGANGSTKRWEGARRINQSGLCGVDMEGDCTGYDGDGKAYKCHGSGFFFNGMGRMSWDVAVMVMRTYVIPYAVMCLDGGHVIGLHLSSHKIGLVYSDPVTGIAVEDGAVLVLAADGYKANPGQPTTVLQRAELRKSKKPGRLYAFIGAPLEDDGLRATMEV